MLGPQHNSNKNTVILLGVLIGVLALVVAKSGMIQTYVPGCAASLQWTQDVQLFLHESRQQAIAKHIGTGALAIFLLRFCVQSCF